MRQGKIRNSILVIAGIVFFSSYVKAAFRTLDDAIAYAWRMEEYPERDAVPSASWLNPDFSSFHRRHLRSPFKRLWDTVFANLHIKKPPIWSPKQFKVLLERVRKQRQEGGYTRSSVVKFTPRSDVTFTIWGSLHGAFHSLVRCLIALRKKKTISGDFIIKPNHFFVFLGNVIDGSPFILETLTLILRLMEVNPDAVFFLRGSHEHKQKWHRFGLQRELAVRARHLSDEKIPLGSIVHSFFKSLPFALYLRGKSNGSTEFIRLSHFARTFPKLRERFFADFLLQADDGTPQFFLLKHRTRAPSKKTLKLSAVITSIKRNKTYKKTHGLQKLFSGKELPQWGVFSSPTRTHRMRYEFFYDAFCFLEIGKTFEDTILRLYYQETPSKKEFEKDRFHTETYQLLSGEKEKFVSIIKPVPVPKMEEKLKKVEPTKKRRLVIGTTLSLSRNLVSMGKPMENALSVVINRANQAGGVNGQIIQLIILDDQYNPILTKEHVKTLINRYKTDIILSPIGTPTLKAILPRIEKQEISVFFPRTGGLLFRNPKFKMLVHHIADYPSEAKILVEYAVDELQLKRFVFFYQDDAYGQDLLQGAEVAAKKRNIKTLAVSYQRGTVQVEGAAQKIKEYNPDAIFFFSIDAPSIALIQTIGVAELTGKVLLGPSPVVGPFKRFVQKKELRIIVSQLVPDFQRSNLPIVKEFRSNFAQEGYALSSTALSAYIGAEMFLDLLRRVEGEVTKEKLIRVAEQTKEYTFKGLKLDFDPHTRSFARAVWLDTGKGEWIEKPLERKTVSKEKTITVGAVLPPKKEKQSARDKDVKGIVVGTSVH